MQKITKQELLAIARMSRVQLDDQEVVSLIDQVDAVLTYALRVKDIARHSTTTEFPLVKNRNVFREDVVEKTNPKDILAQAPECEQNYFVVPVILETT